MRSMEPVRNVKAEELDNYNPEAFDARKNDDGTFDLIPVRWMSQEEYNEAEYGCGDEPEDYPPAPEMPHEVELTPEQEAFLEEQAKRDAEEYVRWERGPGAK